MDHNLTVTKNTGLLVSIRNAEEARIAVATNCVSIIDLKEPTDGSLGCVSISTAMEVLNELPANVVKSIALGEVIDWPIWPDAGTGSARDVLARFDYAKVGLSGLADDPVWKTRWKDCLSKIPDGVERVAVAYADSDLARSPSVELVVESARDVGCSVLLIDTYDKSSGGLLDWIEIDTLSAIVGGAQKKGLKVVLAGSLGIAEIKVVQSADPDYVAVRGAVCNDARTSTIVAEKIIDVSGKALAAGIARRGCKTGG